MEIQIFKSSEFAINVADYLVNIMNLVLSRKDRLQISLCGGSTPAEIYRTLTLDRYQSQVSWDRVDLFLGDERFVPLEDPKSNYLMIKNNLLNNLSGALPVVFPINDKAKSSQECATEYSQVILEHVQSNHNGVPQFDIMLLGVGEDGHTASLFPKNPAIHDSTKICLNLTHPNDGTERISLSKSVIQSATQILFLIKGESKKEIVKKLIQGSYDYDSMPARLYVEVSNKVTFLLDDQCARLLD